MLKRMLITLGAAGAVLLIAGAFAAGAFGDDGASSANGGPGTSPQEPPQDQEGMQRILAPIEDARIEPASIDGRYALHGVAGLPGGCAQPDGFDVTRDGTTITVEVYDLVPSDGRPCTMIYGTYPLAIGLGTDLEPGVEYTVDVNGTILTFVA